MADSKAASITEQMEQSILGSEQKFDMMIDETLFQEAVREGGNLNKTDNTTTG
jgi:hypothetical protein